MSTFVKSGIAPLDRQIGGFVPGRPYLISGNPGTGKSCACLEFIDAGVQQGERGLILTHDDPGDLLDSAEFLGIDLGENLLSDRVRIVTFQLDFVRRFMRAATPMQAFEELLRHIGGEPVQRITIDSIVPFLEGGGAGSQSIFSLVDFLDALQATALITYPGDLAGLYDQRLEPLLQRAGGVFHLAASEHGRRRGSLLIRKLRHQAQSVTPVRYKIDPGFGYAAAVLAEMQAGVVAVEADDGAAALASAHLAAAGLDGVKFISGPLHDGAPAEAPYDVILIEGGVEEVPAPLVAQLKDGGRIGAIFMQGALGTVRIGLKRDGVVNWRFAFNATAPILPGFAAARKFVL